MTATFSDFVDMNKDTMTTALDSLSVASGDKVILVKQGHCVSFGRLQT